MRPRDARPRAPRRHITRAPTRLTPVRGRGIRKGPRPWMILLQTVAVSDQTRHDHALTCCVCPDSRIERERRRDRSRRDWHLGQGAAPSGDGDAPRPRQRPRGRTSPREDGSPRGGRPTLAGRDRVCPIYQSACGEPAREAGRGRLARRAAPTSPRSGSAGPGGSASPIRAGFPRESLERR